MTGSRKLRIAGIDDAGRGPVIGPLLICGVAVDEEGLRRLSEIGVKDSKLLSPGVRAQLYEHIKRIAEKIVVHKIDPQEIDEYVMKGKMYRRLNYLEAITMGQVASELDPDIVYVDASDINPERFALDLRSTFKKDAKVVSEHHADSIYPVVSAASIVAKCERDAEVAKIAERYGDFGSGYPSDPRTISFLNRWVSTYGEMPPFSRKSWKTWKKIGSKKLEEF